MISIVTELIDPASQAAIWGTAAYLGSKAGQDTRPKGIAERKQATKKHLVQGTIGAGAGFSGAYGAAGLAKGLKSAKKAITGDE